MVILLQNQPQYINCIKMYICYLKLLSDALFDSQGLIKKTERNKLAGKNVASKRFL